MMIDEIVARGQGDKKFTKEEFEKFLQKDDGSTLHDSIAEFSDEGGALIIEGVGYFQLSLDKGGSTRGDYFNSDDELLEADLDIGQMLGIITKEINGVREIYTDDNGWRWKEEIDDGFRFLRSLDTQKNMLGIVSSEELGSLNLALTGTSLIDNVVDIEKMSVNGNTPSDKRANLMSLVLKATEFISKDRSLLLGDKEKYEVLSFYHQDPETKKEFKELKELGFESDIGKFKDKEDGDFFDLSVHVPLKSSVEVSEDLDIKDKIKEAKEKVKKKKNEGKKRTKTKYSK